MTREVVVVGAGGMGREVLDVLEAVQENGDAVHVVGVVDDQPSEMNLRRLHARGYDYLGTIAEVTSQYRPGHYLIGIGAPSARRSVASRFDAFGWAPLSVIHPSATVGSEVTLGTGVIVCAGARLSTNIVLERHVLVNSNVTVGHDTTFGAFGAANPGAQISGEVTLSPNVLVGTGAAILQGLKIGENAIIGANACVTKDVPIGATVLGVPARRRQEN